MLTYDDVELDESSAIVQMRRIQESMDKDVPVPGAGGAALAAGGLAGHAG